MERQCRRSILQITMVVVLLIVHEARGDPSGKVELADGESADIEICNGGCRFVDMKVTITTDNVINDGKTPILERILYCKGASTTNEKVNYTEHSDDNKTFVFTFQANVSDTISHVSCAYKIPRFFGTRIGDAYNCNHSQAVTVTTKDCPNTPLGVQSGCETTNGKVTESSNITTATVSVELKNAIEAGGKVKELRKQLIESFPDLTKKLEALDAKQLKALQKKLQPLKDADHQAIRAATEEFLESQQQAEGGISELVAGVIAGVIFVALVAVGVTSCYCCKCCCWKTKTNPEDSLSGSTDLQTIESPTAEPTTASGRKTSSESSKSSADSKYSKAVSIGSSVDGKSNDSAETGSVTSWERKLSDDQSDISGSVRSDDSKSTDSSGSSAEGSIRLTYSTTSNVVSLKKK